MDAKSQEKLLKIVRMMSTDNDHERAAAARAFHNVLASAKVNFDKLKIDDNSNSAQDAATEGRREFERRSNLLFRIAVLESFVSQRVAEIARHQAKAEAERCRSELMFRWRRDDPGGRPSWARDKAI